MAKRAAAPVPAQVTGMTPDPARAEPAHPHMAAHSVRHVGEQPVSVRTLVTAALIVLGIVAVVAFLASIIGIVLVVLIAIVFAEGIRPLVYRLRERGVPVPLGIIGVYVALLAFLAALIALLVQPLISEATSLAGNFHTYRDGFLSVINHLQSQFHFNLDISKQVGDALGATQQILLAIGTTIGGILIDLVLVLVVGFLWLVSSDRLKAFTVDLFPEEHHALVVNIVGEMGFRMGGFLRAVAISSLVVGVAVGLACFFLGLPSPILLGIFAGIMGAIPLVGPFIGVVPPVLLGFTISPAYPILVLAVLLVIQLIDANTVLPVVMNRVVALPALGVVLALLIGGALQGLIGALLAVPVAAAIQVLIVRAAVPAVHHAQGRTDAAYAKAYVPLSPHLKASAPRGGGRRVNPR